jgi:hypothetical protein
LSPPCALRTGFVEFLNVRMGLFGFADKMMGQPC